MGSERSKYDCKVDFSPLISSFYVHSELRYKFSITRYFVTISPEMLENLMENLNSFFASENVFKRNYY